MKQMAIRASAVAAAAIASFLLASALHSASEADAGLASSTPAAARTVPDTGVSDNTVGALRSQGVTVSTMNAVDASNVATRITKADALKRAAGSFGFVNNGKATGISLARLTGSEYGQELESDPSKPSRVNPLIKDRLVWVVEFHDFTPFVSQPLPDPKDTRAPNATEPKANASMLAAVDPATGEVIWGQQF